MQPTYRPDIESVIAEQIALLAKQRAEEQSDERRVAPKPKPLPPPPIQPPSALPTPQAPLGGNARILISPDQMRASAAKFANEAMNLENLLANLSLQVETAAIAWSDEEVQTYRALLEKWNQAGVGLTDIVNTVSQHLNQAAQGYEDADQSMARGFAAGPPSGQPKPAPSPIAIATATNALDARIQQLRQIRTLFDTYPDLLTVLDAVIGNKIKEAEDRQKAQDREVEKRQNRLSILLTFISLVAGWMLSLAGSPAALFNVVHH